MIALAETFGAALRRETSLVFLIGFIAGYGAVALAKRVMYGVRPGHDNSDDSPPAIASENEQLGELPHGARVAFEFQYATWSEGPSARRTRRSPGLACVRPPYAYPLSPPAS